MFHDVGLKLAGTWRWGSQMEVGSKTVERSSDGTGKKSAKKRHADTTSGLLWQKKWENQGEPHSVKATKTAGMDGVLGGPSGRWP